MHSSPWSYLSQLPRVPETFIAAHEFITVPLWQQPHSYSPSHLPLTTGILEHLHKSNSPDIPHPYFESPVTLWAVVEETRWWRQGQATTLAATGSCDGTGIERRAQQLSNTFYFPLQTIFSQTIKLLFLAVAVLFFDLVPMVLTV